MRERGKGGRRVRVSLGKRGAYAAKCGLGEKDWINKMGKERKKMFNKDFKK